MYDEMESYISDSDNGEVGWSILLDLNRVPTKALPWLAQFTGVRLDQSLSDANQRQQIADAAGLYRGSLASIVAAAQRHLTGTKDVLVEERYQGSAYKLWMATRTAQTPNTAVTLADILTQKPAGIVLTYQTVAGQTFGELLGTTLVFSTAYTTYTTFEGVLRNAPGT